MGTFSKIERRRYSDQVVQSIKAEILSEHFAEGDKLPGERELMKQFKVSRTVIREALRVLEESGMVETRKGPKGGFFVIHVFHKPISTSLQTLVQSGDITIDHLFDVRLLVEPHIAAEAAARATVKDLESLKVLLDESISHQDDVVLLKRNNIDFHLLLARVARNPVLTLLMESVTQLLREFSETVLDLPFGRTHCDMHRKLFALIKEGKSEEASRLITEDILRVRNRLKGEIFTQTPRSGVMG